MTGPRTITTRRSKASRVGGSHGAGSRGHGGDRVPTRAGGGPPAGDAEADQVLVGIETDRGPWVQALIAAGQPPRAKWSAP